MSISLLFGVLKTHIPMTSTQHHILLCLAAHANDNNLEKCFPSIMTISKECRLSRSAVINNLKNLEEMGILFIEKRTKENGGNASNNYIINSELIRLSS